MKNVTTVVFALCTLFLAATAFGQAFTISWYHVPAEAWPYDPPGPNPLGYPCSGGTTYSQSETFVCVYWDRNANGPDLDDQLAEIGTGYGQGTWSCLLFNSQGDLGDGYFATANFQVNYVPTDVDSGRYYLEVSGNGYCWQSNIYHATPGQFKIYMRDDTSWTCREGACRTVTPPNPPANFAIQEPVGCLSLTATWEHDGLNVSGFNIYMVKDGDDELVANVNSEARTAQFAIPSNLLHDYYAVAYNNGGPSGESNHDDALTYLVRFGEECGVGQLCGRQDSSSQFTLTLQRPTDQCPSHCQLMMVVTGTTPDTFLLADVQLTTSSVVSATLPSVTIQDPADTCHLFLRAEALDIPGLILEEASDSVFWIYPEAADDREVTLPSQFELSQNYPNPFNPVTEIQFAVPVQAEIRIGVYNIMGQLVKTLAQGTYSAGFHHVSWDGTSESGVTVSSGLYLCRMSGPSFVQTRKMMLMK